ncbi:MAG TPA: MFS transporter [Microbacterium sp.]|nr:MFS transporter [Microbacterium sp.]
MEASDPASGTTAARRVPLSAVLRGRRGFFLVALLLAEFGAAMQGIAYSTILPLVAEDLDGFGLFGATLAAGNIAAVAMLALAPRLLGRFRPGVVLFAATVLYIAGAALAVFAPAMAWVLAGTVVRGVAAGLLAGVGMGAIGALYDEDERPRVFGLFSLVWLLPSFVGPALNAVVAEWAGWRWALAWPAILVLLARLLMGRYIGAIPWEPHRSSARPAVGLAVAGVLALGAAGSSAAGPWGIAAFVVGVLSAAAGISLFLARGSGAAAGRVLRCFALVCAAYFGVYELLSLTVVEGLGESVVWASVAISAALVAWSVVGLRPMPRARVDAVVVGTGLILASIVGMAAAVQLFPPSWALVVIIASAVLAGLGMGLSYPLLSSEPFTVSGGVPASTTGALVAFAETAGTAWAALVGGGLYSLAHASGLAARPSLFLVFLALGVVSMAAIVTAVRRRR